MLFYLILLTLTFVCPIVVVLILLGLLIKYHGFIKTTGINAKVIDFDGHKRNRQISYQGIWLVVSTILLVLINRLAALKLIGLVILVAILLWLFVQALIAIQREHTNVDVQAIENDNDVDLDTVRILIEKRSILYYAVSTTIMLINVGILLNLLIFFE
ncbi:hypothetical protein MOO44_03260 [Nicoliella spurrieriana]|uniref:Uncharacterized protein n=1 Tax=Nicoliella spurrieriana TaxID=2925830 RepID=A0A976X5R1_9LACO|nr:hypothetical protein [Nicoliella spurrieriana]UQS87193.1 hypothetical protein MOO44_03260 [Nicoliella spurrieriana]